MIGSNQIHLCRESILAARGGEDTKNCSLCSYRPYTFDFMYVQVKGEAEGVASFTGFLPRGNSLVDLATRPTNDRCFMCVHLALLCA